MVSQADPSLRHWGPWQFPAIHRLPDGRLAVGYHVEADSATAYGKPPGLSISTDDGQTWQQAGADEIAVSSNSEIFTLPNGDLFRQVPLRSVDPATVEGRLPPSVGKSLGGYRNEIIGFDATQMPADPEGYRFSRR